jgi:hypothetical protein
MKKRVAAGFFAYPLNVEFNTLFDDLDDSALTQLEREFQPLQTPDLTADQATDERPVTGDFDCLVRFADPLLTKYDDIGSVQWELSPIGWIRHVSSAHKRGKIGEEIVRAWAKHEGLPVGGRGHRGHDCLIAGMKIEVKTSLRWNSNRFAFFGLRDLEYHAVALLGLEPQACHLWIVPKDVLWEHAHHQLRGMEWHNTKWISFFSTKPPAWLRPWGGSFAQASRAVRTAADRCPPESTNDTSTDDLTDDEAWLAAASQINWPWRQGSTRW